MHNFGGNGERSHKNILGAAGESQENTNVVQLDKGQSNCIRKIEILRQEANLGGTKLEKETGQKRKKNEEKNGSKRANQIENNKMENKNEEEKVNEKKTLKNKEKKNRKNSRKLNLDKKWNINVKLKRATRNNGKNNNLREF
ncbi:ribonuclease 3-like [Palaemon carinicauda]|uniref:ribonuclease 3-like n=1 Tax=Palaemon carinicauda TaxID=392227 RepID=UPI0035B6848C